MFDSIKLNAAENNPQDKVDSQDFKKKRDEYNIQIRREKRDNILTKKRNRNLEIDYKIQHSDPYAGIDSNLKTAINTWIKQTFEMSQFMELVEAANSNDRMKQHYGLIGLRKILSNEQNPPIQHVIDANMVPKLIQYMQNEDEPHLQMEATWALTNIASGTSVQTQSIIDKGGIPCFIQLLKSNNMEIAEQAIWAIGNISGDSPHFRDIILKKGGLPPLLHIVNHTTDNGLIKNGTWAISNLCRGKPLPEIKLVEAAIPTLCGVIKRESDSEVLTDAAWALSYSARGSSHISTVIATGIIPYLIANLDNKHLPLLIPCLRILGNIISGTIDQTNAVLGDPEFLSKLFHLTQHIKIAIRRESFWTISNILAGTPEQIGLVLNNADFFNAIRDAALLDVDDVKKEAAWALSNATKHATPLQIGAMIQHGLLDCFIKLLDSNDSKTVEIILEGINNILNWGAYVAKENQMTDNEFLAVLESKGGVVKIEELQSHPNNDVYTKALKILETHFELEGVL